MPNRFGPEEHAHDVEIVRGEVDDHPHVPHAGRKRAEPRRPNLEHAAQLPVVQPAAELSDGRVEPLDVADGEQPTGRVGGRDHDLGLAAIGGNRLLDQDVRAGVEGLEGGRQMERRRDGHHHEVGVLRGEEGRWIGVARCRPPGGGPRDGRRVEVGHGHEVHIGQLIEDPGMVGPHHPEADHRPPQALPAHAATRLSGCEPSSAATAFTASITASTSSSLKPG